MLSDGDLVRNLLSLYCERIDAADYDGVGALFGDRGELADEHGRVLARGVSALARFYRDLIQLHDGAPRTKHVVTNTVLEPDGESKITARSSFVLLQATEQLPLQPIMAGRYVDHFERVADEEWRWVERRFASDLTGHLSQHLGRL